MKLRKTTSNFFLKNWRMRTLSARIFSKSFGGKIKQFLNRCYREAFLSGWRMRIVQSFKTKIGFLTKICHICFVPLK